MKNWICYNLFGEHSNNITIFGMVGGLTMLSFLVGCACYLFIYIPFFYL